MAARIARGKPRLTQASRSFAWPYQHGAAALHSSATRRGRA